MPAEISPILIAKPIAWFVAIVAATLLLRRRWVTKKVRLAFLFGGVLVFGFLFGQIATQRLDPNPVDFLRNVLHLATGLQQPMLPPSRETAALSGVVILALLLTVGWASNKAVCGWACQLGLLQDLIHRVPLPKWRPPFWLSNTVRGVAFVGLLLGLLVAGIDWIAWINPFQVFRIEFTWAIGTFAGFLLIASLFTYRPWCQFLCPFGFVSWLVEQFSLLRPRINWEKCKKCQLCVNACPTQAMADLYSGRRPHADCFACGACIVACPQKEALRWQRN